VLSLVEKEVKNITLLKYEVPVISKALFIKKVKYNFFLKYEVLPVSNITYF
jgi:hypothetical protein